MRWPRVRQPAPPDSSTANDLRLAEALAQIAHSNARRRNVAPYSWHSFCCVRHSRFQLLFPHCSVPRRRARSQLEGPSPVSSTNPAPNPTTWLWHEVTPERHLVAHGAVELQVVRSFDHVQRLRQPQRCHDFFIQIMPGTLGATHNLPNWATRRFIMIRLAMPPGAYITMNKTPAPVREAATPWSARDSKTGGQTPSAPRR